MKDKLLDFVENHRVLCIVLIVFVILFGVCLAIRSHNLKNKAQDTEVVVTVPDTSTGGLVQDVIEEVPDTTDYLSSLGLGTDKNDGRIEVTEEETEVVETETEPIQTEPTYKTVVTIFDWTSVPSKNMDGSSCKSYLKKVSLSDFGTFWGSSLTQQDFFGNNLYLVGVTQNPEDVVKGDLQSVGWLINNIKSMKPNDAVKFTNLHVIGSLSDNHVALLCSYDWYSAYGLNDTLVVFEDISGTLSPKDFKDGDIFSATAFVHNIKVLENVKGKRVVVVQYNVFK